MSNLDNVNKNNTLNAKNNNVKTANFGKKGLRVEATDRTLSINSDTVMELRPVRRNTKVKRSNSFIFMQWFGVTLSIFWLLGAGAYIDRTIGWDQISTFLPHELGGFLAGVFAPVALLWMVLAFVMRSNDVKMYADALRGELQAMIFPSAQAEKRINNDIERLIQQSAEMSRATGMAAETLEVAKRTLQDQMGRFQDTTQKAAGNVTELNTSLNDRMTLLGDLTFKLTEQTSAIEDKARASTQTWERAIAKAKDMAGVLDTSTGALDEKTETFSNVIDRLSTLQLDTARSVDRAKEMIEEQRAGLMEDADRAVEYVGQVAEAMSKGTDKLYGLTDDSVDKAKLVETRIQGQVASLERVLAGADSTVEKLAGATEKSVASAGGVQSAVEKAVDLMDAATQRAKETADDAMNSIGQKVQETASSFTDIQNQVRSMADLFDARREAMELSGQATGKQAEQIRQILDETLDKIAIRSSQLIAQVEQFRQQIDDPIQHLDAITQDIGTKSSSFAQILGDKIKELTDASDTVGVQAGDVEQRLDKRTKSIAILAGKIAGDTKKIGQEMDKQEERLSTRVIETVQSLSNVNQGLLTQSDKLTMVSDQSIERFKMVEKTLSERRRQLTDEAATAEKAITKVVSTFDDKARQINKHSAIVLNDVKTLNTALDDRAERFGQVSDKVVERIKKAQEAFAALQTGYKNVADDSVQKLAQASGSFVDTLSTLRTGSADASKIVEDVALKASQSAARVESLTSALSTQAAEVEQSADRVVSKMSDVKAQTETHFNGMSDMMAASVDKMEDAFDKFASTTDVIDSATGKVLGKFDEASQTFYTYVDRMDAAADKTVTTARDVSRSVIQQTEAMIAQSQSAVSELDHAGARLAGKAQSVKDLIGSTVATADTLADALNARMGDMTGLAENSTERIENALNKLIAYTQKIDKSSQALAEKLGTVSIVGSKVANDVDSTVVKLQKQADMLIEASTKASDQMDKAQAQDGKAKREGFLSSTKFVVESLHSLSLDFARMLQGELPEKTWKAYQRGDTNAFTRHILALKDEASHDKIRDKFKDDYEFRTYVQRYFRQFEEVYDQARGNDHGDLLGSVFMTSDVGKLYIYLCAVLKRDHRAGSQTKSVA